MLDKRTQIEYTRDVKFSQGRFAFTARIISSDVGKSPRSWTHVPLDLTPGAQERGDLLMATSKLQRHTLEAVYLHFGQYTIQENYRPDWLDRLELDIFIESLSTAIEIQGPQHYEFIPFYHRSDLQFRKQKERDKRKKEICETVGIDLFYVYSDEDISSVIATIKSQHNIYKSTIGSGWMSDDQLPLPSMANYHKRFKKLMGRMSGAHQHGKPDLSLKYAYEILFLCQKENLLLTPRNQKVLTKYLNGAQTVRSED